MNTIILHNAMEFFFSFPISIFFLFEFVGMKKFFHFAYPSMAKRQPENQFNMHTKMVYYINGIWMNEPIRSELAGANA